jgi:hypothetical protein
MLLFILGLLIGYFFGMIVAVIHDDGKRERALIDNMQKID